MLPEVNSHPVAQWNCWTLLHERQVYSKVYVTPVPTFDHKSFRTGGLGRKLREVPQYISLIVSRVSALQWIRRSEVLW